MKLAIFGATRGTGRKLLQQALEQNHLVTVLVRNCKIFDQVHKNLHVIQGDVMQQDDVDSVVQGQDVVLCTLGAPPFDSSQVRANGAKNIVQSMQKYEVKRLVCLSGIGVGYSYELLPFYYKFLIIPLLLRRVYADHELQENYIKQSQLDWIIVRAAALTDGEHTSNYFSGTAVASKGTKLKISRADTADFMLKQLSDESNLGKTPSLSY